MSETFNAKRVFLLALVGVAMNFSPILGTSESAIFIELQAFPEDLVFSRVCNLAAFACTTLLLVIAGNHAQKIFTARWFYAVTSAIGIAGMLVGCLVGLKVLPIYWIYIGATLRGVFWGPTVVIWVNTLASTTSREAGAAVAGAFILYAGYGLFVYAALSISGVLATALLIICPAVGLAGCLAAHDEIDKGDGIPSAISAKNDKPSLPKNTLQRPSFKTKALLYGANGLFGIMLGAILHYFALADTPIYIFAFLITACILTALFVFLRTDIGFDIVLRVFMIIFALSTPVLVLLHATDSTATIVLISATLMVILLYTVVIFADTQARFTEDFWRIPGSCQIFAALGMIASSLLLHFAFPRESINPSDLLLFSATCVIFVAALFSPTGRSISRPWGFASLMPTEPEEQRRLRRCGELADSHELTARELEILQQLVAGRTKDEIADALVISPATAKTHIRNIYTKLNVHSQKELFDLVEG